MRRTVKLSTRGRVTIPKDLRDKLDLKQGTVIQWKILGPDRVLAIPEQKSP